MTNEELIDILRDLPEGDEVKFLNNGSLKNIGGAISLINDDGYPETHIMTERDYETMLLREQYGQ